MSINFRSLPFTASLVAAAPHTPGVYALWRNGAVVYYGKASAGAISYTTPSFTSAPGAISFTITGLSPATTRAVVVRARDAAGNRDGGTGSVVRACSSVSRTVAPRNGGRPVKSSYRIAPRA